MNVAKKLRSVLNDPKIIDEILKNSRDMDEAYCKLGYVMSYHISTRSKNSPKIQGAVPYELYEEPEIQKLSPEKLKKNVIDKGFVTHSFNGYNLGKVKKHGLGSSKIYEEQLGDDLNFLCSVLGEGTYTENQGGGEDEIYYTAPGAKTFHYACAYSPERLWLGPLRQDRKNAIPIIVGETKVQYAKRLLRFKLSELKDSISPELKEECLRRGDSLIEKMCSCKPVVALIPIRSKKYELTACHATTKNMQNGQHNSLIELLEKGTGSYNPEQVLGLFTENTNNIEFNNLGNLVHNGIIPPSELELLEVEDSFVLMQRRAKLLGLEEGEFIDFFTGRKYESQKFQSNEIKPNMRFAKRKIIETTDNIIVEEIQNQV